MIGRRYSDLIPKHKARVRTAAETVLISPHLAHRYLEIAAMNEAPGFRADDAAKVERARQPWNALLGRGLFEAVIVAVGVFLALAVDEWRERSGERQLAAEARAALKSELLANREALLMRIRRTARLYEQTAARPDQVAQLVSERRNRPLQLNDAAWTMTIETGAIRWLEPDERAKVADVYAAHERMRDIVLEEMVRWTELAAFPATSTSTEAVESRDRAIRLWQAYALRTQMAECVSAGRHERALGANVTIPQVTDFCATRPAEEDPASIYREWKKLGWLSPEPSQVVAEPPAAR